MASQKIQVLANAFTYLNDGDEVSARECITRDYPFVHVPTRRKSIPQARLMKIFIRDHFIDRYTGERLIFPGALRVLSLRLPDAFPAHPNWKMSESHVAYWLHFPTVDHVNPVACGGTDDDDNLVTTSMTRNGIKGNSLLPDIGWTLRDIEQDADWDGLLTLTMGHVANHPELIVSDSYLRNWVAAARKAIGA